MVIVVMTKNNVLYETFDNHRSFLIFNVFYELNVVFFPEQMFYPFRHQ